MFAGPFILALVLLLLFAPFLGCCCCCPNCCPSKCCRQPDDKNYTKCELKCPSFFTILALLIAIGGASYGFLTADSVNSTIKKMACSFTLAPDDFLNGNVTTSGTQFFTGLNVLSSSLNDFNSNLTQINNILSNFNTSNTNMTTALSNGNTLKTNIKDTDGNTGNGMTPLTYPAPIS